jgi:hypothetical protein
MSSWRVIAEWDWVEADDSDDLHAVDTLENEDTADAVWCGEGTTACGISGELTIPGMFTRMSATRCPACCDATGMPHGKQSPKNVDECRPIAEARIERFVS